MTDYQIDEHFDWIIIGTGSGNSLPSTESEDKKIAIVEKGRFGGTCLNVGCIPTKMFVYAADTANAIRGAGKYGIDAEYKGVDWPSIVSRVFDKRIDPIADGGENYRRGDETPNITVFDQHATFVGPKTIKTGQGSEEKIISADQIILAAGSRPMIPEAIAKSGVKFHTNQDIMRLPALPEHMTIVGGGFIASEFAHVFASLGVNVTVLNRTDRLLRKYDADIAKAFTEIASRQWDLRLNVEILEAAQDGDKIALTLSDGTKLDTDCLLVATGRVPNGDQMDLELGGVESDRGLVKVDEYGRTSAEGVWALGDICSEHALKHVANAHARVIQHNLLHPDDLKKFPPETPPSAVFTDPQLAAVGMTEEQAREAGHNVTVKIQKYGDVAYGWAMEDTENFCKLIADNDTGKLLGAHYMGPQASTLIQQMITVMAFDLDVREVARGEYWIHPALPELTENALLGLEF